MSRRALLVVSTIIGVLACLFPMTAAQAWPYQVTGSVAIAGDTGTPPLFHVHFEPTDGTASTVKIYASSTFEIEAATLPDGTYKVRFVLDMMDGLERYYTSQSPAGTTDPGQATVIALGAGGTPTLRMVMPPIGRVVGQVTDSEGRAVPGVGVEADRVTKHARSLRAVTDAEGRYDLGYLQEGERLVDVSGSGDLAGRRLTVTVPAVGTATADAILTGPAGRITGVVTDPDTGTPLPFAQVQAFLSPGFVRAGLVNADATGHYEIAGLRTATYWLQADDVIADNRISGGASDVPVTAGETTVRDLTVEYDSWVDPGHTLSGTVTDDLGQPIPGIEVDVQRVGGLTVAATSTDRHGRWETTTPAGDFVIATAPARLWETLAPGLPHWGRQYYPDAVGLADADVVTVSGGAPVDDLDMTLSPAGVIPLDLRDARGEVVQKAGYRLFDAETGAEVQSVPSWLLFRTDAVRLRIHPGSWKVLVLGRNPDESLPQWYGGGTSFASAPTIDLAPGEILPLQELTLPDGLTPTTGPRILGKPRVGGSLRVTHGQWNLMTDTGFSYRWRRGTTEVAASQRYVVRRADRGRWLTAVVYADNVSGSAERRVRIFVKR